VALALIFVKICHTQKCFTLCQMLVVGFVVADQGPDFRPF
jgi:hypothetical protein